MIREHQSIEFSTCTVPIASKSIATILKGIIALNKLLGSWRSLDEFMDGDYVT